jgi:plastocyanin
VNAQLAAPVQAKAADEFGNGVAGVAVGWTAVGAAVSAASVPTDASGISSVGVTLGDTPGPITIVATAQGLNGSPLTFNATATSAPPPNPTSTVNVVNNEFIPASITISAGTTVTWSWAANAQDHNVVPDATEPVSSGGLVDGPHTYQYTFNNPGTYRYHCSNHGAPGGIGMSGTVTVN